METPRTIEPTGSQVAACIAEIDGEPRAADFSVKRKSPPRPGVPLAARGRAVLLGTVAFLVVAPGARAQAPGISALGPAAGAYSQTGGGVLPPTGGGTPPATPPPPSVPPPAPSSSAVTPGASTAPAAGGATSNANSLAGAGSGSPGGSITLEHAARNQVSGADASGRAAVPGAGSRIAPPAPPPASGGELPFTGFDEALLLAAAVALLGTGLGLRWAGRHTRERDGPGA